SDVKPNSSTPVEKASVYSSTKNNSLPATGDSTTVTTVTTVLGLTLLVASGYASLRRRKSL
ncbi:TPA: LPXTG cell wall anchor domain-containing protein, partial [Streptococcus suis]